MIICAIALSALVAAPAGNLLSNPGFDEVDGRGMPTHWDVFVLPMKGAVGRLDSEPLEGLYAAMLHIPEAYPEDPANNWSQDIIEKLGGQELTVSGNIKTETATEAAIWLQCWARSPLRVIAVASTSTDSPVYGTQDWSRVQMTVQVPEATEFVLLRCVLKGMGTAWFDQLRVEVAKPEGDSIVAASDSAVRDNDSGAAREDPLRELRDANEAMAKALEALRETNESLVAQIAQLQKQFDRLQTLAETSPALPRATVPKPRGLGGLRISPRSVPPPTRTPSPILHPLVPRGFVPEKSQ